MRDVTADGTVTLELLPKASPAWAIAAGVADTWARYSTFLAESQTKYLETRATSGTRISTRRHTRCSMPQSRK